MEKKNLSAKNIIDKRILLIIFSLYLIWLFKSYTGNQHSNSINLFKFVLGSFDYINDIGLQNSLFFKSSIFFKIIEIFRINLDNDIIGFFLHIVLSTLSGLFLFLILKKYLNIKNINFIFIFLFISMIIGDFLVLGTGGKSSWVSQTNFSLTYFGQNLRLIFIYLLLAENFIGLIFIAPIILLISIKSTIMTLSCGVLYSIFFYKNKKKLLWLITPALTLFYFYSLGYSSSELSFDEKIFAIETMLKWDEFEAAFHLQPISNLLKLILSFVVFSILLIYSDKNKFTNFSLIVFVVSLANFVFSYIYLKFLYIYLPLPELVMFGPTRLMELYQLVFWIFLTYFIYQLKITNLKKILIFTAMFYLFLATKGLIISFVILSSVLFLHLKKVKKNINNNLALLIFLMLIAPAILYLAYQRYDKNFNHYSFKTTSKWTLGYGKLKKERIDLALKLQKCKDFIFIATHEMKETGRLYTEYYTSSIAGKSSFRGHPVLNNLDIKYVREVEYRTKLLEELYFDLSKKNNISDKIIENFRKYNVALLVNKKFKDKFRSNIKLYEIAETEKLIAIMNEKEELEFEKNCIRKFIY